MSAKSKWQRRVRSRPNQPPGDAQALSIWAECWEPAAAYKKYLADETLDDDELNSLVEFGTLTLVVQEDWFKEVPKGEEDEETRSDCEFSDVESGSQSVSDIDGANEDYESESFGDAFGEGTSSSYEGDNE